MDWNQIRQLLIELGFPKEFIDNLSVFGLVELYNILFKED